MRIIMENLFLKERALELLQIILEALLKIRCSKRDESN